MLTKTAFSLLEAGKTGFKSSFAPLGVGFTAMDVGSGQSSVPQAILASGTGFAGFEGGKHLATKMFSKIPKIGKWGRLGSTVGFLGGLAGSTPAFMAGRKAGEFIPGFKHKQLT